MIFDVLSNVFTYIDAPISFILTNRQWYTVSKDPHARAEWLIYKFGKAHALFHAVRLGNTFITAEVIQALLARNVILSRYFIQRLLMHFGCYDEKLIELKIEHNVNQADFDRIRAFQKKLQLPWASNLSLMIFTRLITEGYNILNDTELATKGNDMELFHFLSAGPLVINHAPQKLLQNINEIEDLIKNKKFIPFPPRPKPVYEDTVHYVQSMQARAHEEYPPKDGYENSRQLNVIARAILIHPDLVLMWKEIGYRGICNDVNELVMQGALLILFPPTPPADWECPSERAVVGRLNQLINLGFQLNDAVMEEALHLFEHRLNEIGNILLNSFQVIRKQSKSEIAYFCLVKTIKPERNHKKTSLLEFLIDRIENPEEALENALEHYNVGFRLDANLIRSTKKIRSLTVHSNLYHWILKTYGPDSKNTQKCFEDILESRVWTDLKLQENPDSDVPENLTSCAFNSICSIYIEFCNEKVPFKMNYLSYLQLASNEEIIKPLFELYLPNLFEFEVKSPLGNTYGKRKFDEINSQQQNSNNMNEMGNWFKLFKKMDYPVNNSVMTPIFKDNFKIFWEKIAFSQELELKLNSVNNENNENGDGFYFNQIEQPTESPKRIKN